ncbi:MAG: hypothetical protein NT002_09965 [candidate division Zixibacteria bacterium]|nr:hypothetical protein [candidate division Zixibacteria bacterium]
MDNFTLQKDAHNFAMSFLTARTYWVLSAGNYAENMDTLKQAKKILEDILEGKEYITGNRLQFTSNAMEEIEVYSFFFSNLNRLQMNGISINELYDDLTTGKETLDKLMNLPATQISADELERTKKLFARLSSVLAAEISKMTERDEYVGMLHRGVFNESQMVDK